MYNVEGIIVWFEIGLLKNTWFEIGWHVLTAFTMTTYIHKHTLNPKLLFIEIAWHDIL